MAPPDESPTAFYDGLADEYHALYDDWWTAAEAHASVVDGMLQAHGVAPPARVLDCACGIGTQAIGLAARGYYVAGTDISPRAIERARREARDRRIHLKLAVSDMRTVDVVGPGPFDAVICCDNSLPHLLDDADLDAALRTIGRVLAPGGLFLASIRDYDALRAERAPGVPGTLRVRAHGREIAGQAWEWRDDGERVRIHLFVLREQSAGSWQGDVHTTWYRALTRAALNAALVRAGFVDVNWHAPDASGYHQPIVTARR